MSFRGINEGLINRIASQMDNDSVQEAIIEIIESKAIPHLEDVKTQARNAENPDEVREIFESMDAASRERIFHDTMAELISTFVQIRIQPVKGGKNLKGLIRDPYTTEALLMMFDEDAIFGNRPDTEVQSAQKDTLRTYLHWIGIALAPEMYDREDVEAMIHEFGADPGLLDKHDYPDGE